MTKKQPLSEDIWVGEINHRLGFKLLLKAEKILFEGTSKFNPKIIVAETKKFGKVLLLGDETDLTLQYSEKWNFYDEMISLVPLCTHEKPRKILIIGGGDGGVLKNVLKFSSIEKVYLSEIDKTVVNVTRKYFDHGKVFDEQRVSVYYEDGANFVKNVREKFDVIIGDYSDPYEGLPASTLVSEKFYKHVKDKLDDNGIFAAQAGSPIYQMEILKKTYSLAKKVFDDVHVYLSPMPIYPGGLWSYILAIKGNIEIRSNCDQEGEFYYNSSIHKASFNLPKFLQDELKA